MPEARHDVAKPVPFDTAKLDALLDDAGIDVLIATSKHNVQYLLGDYRFFFFDYMDAIGVSRYLPAIVYLKGRPDKAGYFGFRLEGYEKENGRFWPRTVDTSSGTSLATIGKAIEHIKGSGVPIGRVGVEAAFLPWDCAKALQDGLGNSEIVDALFPLERLRAHKTKDELAKLREASERVVQSMLTVFKGAHPGMTKHELVQHLRHEEVGRELTFEYCLITAGTSLNRAPSDQRLAAGDIMSLDSGGNYKGYIGDLCRMGILGEPDAELQDYLGIVAEIQDRSRRPIRKGAEGGAIFEAVHDLVHSSPHRPYLEFVAHGMGLVSHEAPRLTARGPVPYSSHDAKLPLEAGMVISIETTMQHPKRGFIKLEDTVVVTDTGWEGLGDTGRGWNPMGAG
jgi:Xaa-Pro aminopeptidase